MKALFCTTLLLAVSTDALQADMTEMTVRHSIGDLEFESVIVYDDSVSAKRAGILMVPNWMGPTESSLKKAKEIAGEDYVVMMADVYGIDTRPQNQTEAAAAAGAVRSDRKLMRKRASTALETFRSQAGEVPLLSKQMAAIGFCFGGGTVLELGRSGANIDAIVSFHGDLSSPTLSSDAGEIKASVLVLHGAEDPFVPQEDVRAFIAAMADTKVDWQLVQFSKTVHSYTDPTANMPGQAMYNELSSERAFKAMNRLFEEIWDR